jgi:hypothetical protein
MNQDRESRAALRSSLFALNGVLFPRRKRGVEHGGLSRVGSTRFLFFELAAMFSSRCSFICLITVVSSLTVPAEAAWSGVGRGGGSGWSAGLARSPQTRCYNYGYPYYAIIPLMAGDGYVPGDRYEYLNAHKAPVRRRSYAATHAVRRPPTDRSAAAVSSTEPATPRVPTSSSKTTQAPAASASPKSPWTSMTVAPPAAEPAKTATEQAGQAANDWAKKFELRLNKLSPDMSAASALLEQEGFRVDSGNKSASGWFLTAHDTNQGRGSIRLQSDGTKIAVTVAG